MGRRAARRPGAALKWRVTGSRYALRDRWLSVRADDCVTPSGVELVPYYVLEAPDFVHVVALDREERVVLVRQYRHGLGGVSLELPGGVMDAEDAGDPTVTAARELREETGYTAARFELVATLSVDPARYANKLHLVLARDVAAGPASPDPGEAIAVEVMPRHEAVRLALRGGIKSAQHVGLLMMALARLDESVTP